MADRVKATARINGSELPKTGRREANKRIKAERIRAAATSLFHNRGYRETTTKMIAAAANVAQGTVFLYAADKRELLLLIINEELDVLTADAFSGVDHDAPLLDQLTHVFSARYHYWGVDPELSLRALQEVLIPQPGDERPQSQFARYQRRREALIAGILRLLEEQKLAGRLRAGENPSLLARVIMAVHLSTVRSWLRNFSPSVDEGIAELRALLEIAIRGSVVESQTTPRGAPGRKLDTERRRAI